MKILVIDNSMLRDSWGSLDIARLVHRKASATVVVRRGPHEDLPKNLVGFDAVLLSGSLTSALEDAPWIESEMTLIRKALDDHKPLLGICYGHQLLARTLGGKESVRKAQRPEFGWIEIDIHKPHRLFENFERKIVSLSSHYDEVHSLPNDANVLASSEDCKIQAFEVTNRPAFGIQFHPERSKEEGKKLYKEKLKSREIEYFLNGERADEIHDDSVGERIVENLLKMIREK